MSHTLAQLKAHVDERRAELAQLRRTLAEVPRDLNGPGDALMEANEQLVLAALHAEAIAETAISNLDELARASQRDPLTDTPNRALMLDRLDNAIAMAHRHRTRIAVLFVDLDDFKQINDRLGHAVGDAVLQLAASRLNEVVRDSDTVSRHGGDEFLVLLSEISQPADAALIAEKIVATLAAPNRVYDHVLSLSASIGIAIYPENGEHAATLISQADAAMYRAKRRGGRNYEFYSAELPGDLGDKPSTTDISQPPVTPFVLRRETDPLIQDLREANEQLVIAALTALEQGAHAEEAHSRQIKFLAMVAHELRSPLTPIRTAADVLKLAPLDDALVARLQVIIDDQVTHMSKLVDDLLDGSCISTGKFQLERSSVEITEILRRSIETCRSEMDSLHQHFQAQLPAGPLYTQADPVRLVQIFSNLLDNASKYTPEGGEIALNVRVHDRTVEIAVSDSGIGITAETLPTIFDLFSQDAHALAHSNGGLGLGLAIVRDLVNAHGGSVVARSAGRNLGSEFVVELPLVDTLPAA
jgi:diguanylate cyclase (GGDEF)-like protein